MGKLFLLNVLPGEPRLPVTLDPLPKGLDRAGVVKRTSKFKSWFPAKQIAPRVA